jgi:hypothetical protein
VRERAEPEVPLARRPPPPAGPLLKIAVTGTGTRPGSPPERCDGPLPRHLRRKAVPDHPLRTWLATFATLLVAVAAWAFASPLGSAPDEPAQLDRAASLVRGQLFGTPLPHPTRAQRGTLEVRVPEVFASLANDLRCYQFKPRVPAGCQLPLVPSKKEVVTETYVGRYPPLYYAFVGLPTLLLVSAKGIYAARLISGALSAAMLALAVVSLARCRGAPLVAAGLGLATTPMVLYLAAVLNPSGLEISSAVSAWAAAVALATAPSAKEAVAPTGTLGLSLVVLLLTRPLSPLWAAAIVVALALVGTACPWRDLLRHRATQAWLGACAAAGAAAGAWDLYANPFLTEPGSPVPPHTSDTGVFVLALERLDLLVSSSIGFFGWLDAPSPEAVRVAWLAVFGLVVLVGAALARARGVVALVGLLGAWVVLPVAVAVLEARSEGILGQGRDYLPLAVGIPVVAGALAGEKFAKRASTLRLVSIVAGLLAASQLADFYAALRRFSVGLAGTLDAFSKVPRGWQPPVPGVVLVAMFAFAMAAFAVILRKAAEAQPTAAGGPA